jgi:hypothetical protein
MVALEFNFDTRIVFPVYSTVNRRLTLERRRRRRLLPNRLLVTVCISVLGLPVRVRTKAISQRLFFERAVLFPGSSYQNRCEKEKRR